jgi:hypothetical protein
MVVKAGRQKLLGDEKIHRGPDSYFKPDDDQVPKANHTKFGCREPVPSFGVFNGHHVHIVEDELHRQQTREEADGVCGY